MNYSTDPPQCQQMLWREGAYRRCTQMGGLQGWRDVAGIEHAACRYHVAELLHRFPEQPVTTFVSEMAAAGRWDS